MGDAQPRKLYWPDGSEVKGIPPQPPPSPHFERDRLRDERDEARYMGKLYTVFALIAGVLIGVFGPMVIRLVAAACGG